jgi:AmmeMemoRadiSam system radical SAM enzyme/AmmeMemoRadiSam system protein B/AmmeMemoRadiSam system protein A
MLRTVTTPPSEPVRADGTKAGGWWHDEESSGRIVCDLCPRGCTLKPGDRGFCFVRENRDGQMVLATYGRSTGFCIDPIEKKPLNHFYPGTSVLSFGTAGCNLGCKFCQNWSMSKSREVATLSQRATPEAIAEAAHRLGCRSVAFTYNDPVIWAEYAIDVARACRAAGIRTVAVTAGYISPAARPDFFAATDAANVDLKGFSDDFYRHLTLARLDPVLETLQWIKAETEVWLEVTNLIIPAANDSADELKRLCDWFVDHLGDEVPLHFSAFHPDFRMRDRGPTPPATLERAYEIAQERGIKYTYVGNVHDERHQSTYCPHCGNVLIERRHYTLGRYCLNGNQCPQCGTTVTGHFDQSPGDWGCRRMPVRIDQFDPALPPNHGPSRGDPAMSKGTQQPSVAARGGVPPELTREQQVAIQKSVCHLLANAVAGSETKLDKSDLAGAAGQRVHGCFVTLRRQGRLRGCCGFIGREMDLAAAITEATIATATRDVRMPTISPTELPMLDVKIALLHSLQPLRTGGAERVAEVEVGRHGLQIVRGASRGLLLPSVATDLRLDAEHFLQQVCLKAGLPATAWRETGTQLLTFEAKSFGGPFDVAAVPTGHLQAPPLVSSNDALRLADACRTNVIALARGATPNFYMSDCPDATAQGVALALRIPGKVETPYVSQLSIRPGLPLQATLLELAKRAAGMLAEGPYATANPESLVLGLAILSDPAMHGTVADPDLKGIDPDRRAVLVTDQDRSAWVFDPGRTPRELLETAAHEAEVRSPATAAVTSFETVSTDGPMVIASLPRARTGGSVRPAAVAGTFYPANPQELSQMVDGLLTEPPPSRQAWAGAMVPHAGLVYSGRLAASVLQRIELPPTIIVVAPKHTRAGLLWAVAPHATWSLPGGSVASDPQLAQELAQSIDGLELDAAAHASEHAIEVQLPLLARLAPHAKVVGIVVGGGDLDRCREFAKGLADVVRARDEETLLLISSDMNHFASDAETRRADHLALAAMKDLQPEQLLETVRREHISMCGVLPAVIVMETLKELGRLRKSTQVGYGTSADHNGNASRVVGYAGLLFD